MIGTHESVVGFMAGISSCVIPIIVQKRKGIPTGWPVGLSICAGVIFSFVLAFILLPKNSGNGPISVVIGIAFSMIIISFRTAFLLDSISRRKNDAI